MNRAGITGADDERTASRKRDIRVRLDLALNGPIPIDHHAQPDTTKGSDLRWRSR
jgi:hypothetical protein